MKISASCPDDIAIEAAETYHTAKGEVYPMSELVQVAFACLASADDKTIKEAQEKVVKRGGAGDVLLPGLKAPRKTTEKAAA
jgi:hypothetical protein